MSCYYGQEIQVQNIIKELTMTNQHAHGDEGHVHGPGCSHHHAQAPIVRESAKIGRNDPCTCGSGKKFKKCCGK